MRETKKLEPRSEMRVREPNSAATVAEIVDVMVLSVKTMSMRYRRIRVVEILTYCREERC